MPEALVALAIIAFGVGTALGAATFAVHARLSNDTSIALALDAQNVLVDLRAATVYDPAQLAALAGRMTSFTLAGPTPVAVTVSIAPRAGDGLPIASVAVRDDAGHSAVLDGVLATEAPAPGAIVTAPTPDPSALPAIPLAGPIPL